MLQEQPLIKLINAKVINFDDVLSIYRKENNQKEGNIDRTTYLLSVANKFFGSWIEAELPNSEVLKVTLPYHLHFSNELISKRGATVRYASDKFRKIETTYRKDNRECYEIIERSKKKNIQTVYLSLGVLSDSSNEEVNGFKEYRKIRKSENNLIHLDGLHRLLSYGINRRKENIKVVIALNRHSSLFKKYSS
jgi:hypothetical protein